MTKEDRLELINDAIKKCGKVSILYYVSDSLSIIHKWGSIEMVAEEHSRMFNRMMSAGLEAEAESFTRIDLPPHVELIEKVLDSIDPHKLLLNLGIVVEGEW